jgi:hypothetical protein
MEQGDGGADDGRGGGQNKRKKPPQVSTHHHTACAPPTPAHPLAPSPHTAHFCTPHPAPLHIQEAARKVRKRNKKPKAPPPRSNVPGEEEQEGEEDPDGKRKKEPANALNMKIFKGFQSFNKEHATASRTITRTLQAVVRTAEWTPTFTGVVRDVSDAYGVLSHLVTVYLNVRAIEVADCPRLLDRNYHAHLIELFADVNYAGAQLSLDQHLRAYLNNPAHQVDADTRQLLKTGVRAARRCKDFFTETLRISVSRHLADAFEDRVKAFVAWSAERVPAIWDAQRHTEDFRAVLDKAGQAVFKFACFTLESDADAVRTAFFTLHPEWHAIDPLFTEWRARLIQLRAPVVLTDKHGNAKPYKSKHPTKRAEYNYRLKSMPHVLLPLMRHMQQGPEVSRRRRGEIKQEIHNELPPGFGKPTRSDVRRSAHLSAVALPWAAEGPEELSAAELRALTMQFKNAVREERERMFTARMEPGTESAPPKFSLLPTFKLAPYCIRLDPDAVSTIGNEAQRRMGKSFDAFKSRKGDRLWFESVFDMFGQERRARRASRASRNFVYKNRRRAVRTGRARRIRKGIPLLWPHAWVLDQERFELRQQDPDCEAPPLINSITTDGVQVHVTIVQRNRSMATGVPELVKKGYAAVSDEPLDVSKHSRGEAISYSRITCPRSSSSAYRRVLTHFPRCRTAQASSSRSSLSHLKCSRI